MDAAVLCTDTSSSQTDAKTVQTDVAILWKDANVFQTDLQTIQTDCWMLWTDFFEAFEEIRNR